MSYLEAIGSQGNGSCDVAVRVHVCAFMACACARLRVPVPVLVRRSHTLRLLTHREMVAMRVHVRSHQVHNSSMHVCANSYLTAVGTQGDGGHGVVLQLVVVEALLEQIAQLRPHLRYHLLGYTSYILLELKNPDEQAE